MKRIYVKPKMDIEFYELNTSIAANCGNVVSQGPEVGGHIACEEFEDIWGDDFSLFYQKGARQTSFYDDGSCECYYSSSGEGYFTS